MSLLRPPVPTRPGFAVEAEALDCHRHDARLVAEVCLIRDLAATATQHAHPHDGACGDLFGGASPVARLLPRPPRRRHQAHRENTQSASGVGHLDSSRVRIDDHHSNATVDAAERLRRTGAGAVEAARAVFPAAALQATRTSAKAAWRPSHVRPIPTAAYLASQHNNAAGTRRAPASPRSLPSDRRRNRVNGYTPTPRGTYA